MQSIHITTDIVSSNPVEGLVSCKNLFPIQLYIYIDNKIIIK
jgi:hypothetical protein